VRSADKNKRTATMVRAATGGSTRGDLSPSLLSDQKATACFRASSGRAMHVQVWWQVDGGYMVAHSDDTPALTHCDSSIPPAVCVRFLRRQPGSRALARLRSSKAWREYTDYFRR
jgi:hypothetical protein